jgi:hypothetical protein
VSCGPNAVTPPIPSIPLGGAPITSGLVLLAGLFGWRFWWVPRRRQNRIAA